jgi:hypothetical protein
MENSNGIQTGIEQTRPLPLSFAEFKKRLDPSANYVVVEKPSTGGEQADWIELAELMAHFEKVAENRHLIYDSSIDKLILIIKLASNVNGRFFQDAISTDALQNLRIYLYSSR